MLRQAILNRKLIQSGISKTAIPTRKETDGTTELQFGSVLVLHLQCKNIAVMSIGALDQFHSLKNLYLYKNNIRRIQGLDFLCNLELLDLSRNNIERIDNLDKCKKLKKLYLGFNEIQVVEGLENLTDLEELQIDDQDIPPGQPLIFTPGIMTSVFHSLVILDISTNQLSSLAPLANLPILDTLDASGNCLKNIDEVITVLQTLYQLRSLNLKGNPLSKMPTYKSSVIGAVYRLEFLDDREIHERVRSSVQNLLRMKEQRARLKQKAEEQGYSQNGEASNNIDDVDPSDFSFSTPTRLLSPLPILPPPKSFKLKKKVQSTPAISAKVGTHHGTQRMLKKTNSDPSLISYASSYTVTDGLNNTMNTASTLDARRSTIQASEFKEDFSLDYDDDGMSDMAKIIFRLSNLDDLGAGDGSGDGKPFHSNYWDLPGSSMIRECRPLSPLEGVDLAVAPSVAHSITSSPKQIYKEEKKASVSFRPKPAAPGGRRCSNNVCNSTRKSIPDPTRSAEDDHFLQQSQENYIYGRTLSPLIELPTPESLTARDENH